ncbi:hypothetical protein FQB35_09985 [Crassaminicella thermophila]|uniref:Uncharacterized protein n=1 Tax=Crassaminicella thermophila TaxID=2599308 RepID=A0A5C0SEN6_CRATE|nr:hypothetical protein [Crassaminicella thermophila]QEK12630.1 hypothetical protein FQB35_09985 [Crassaminicella thermophila]
MFKKTKTNENDVDSLKSNSKKKPFYKRWWFIIIVILIFVSSISSNDKNPNEQTSKENNTESQIEKVTIQEKEDPTEFKADLTLEVDKQNIIATINTNAPDGTLFETSIINADMNNFKSASEFIAAKDGKATYTFTVADWPTGYIGGISSMRFDLEDHPQPANVIDLYGSKGEKAKGDQIVDAHDGFKYGQIQTVTVAYPSKQAVKEKLDKLFIDTLNSMIEKSNGVIISIQPYLKDKDWSTVAVTVSDSWYSSPEHEKERFAEQIATTIEQLIHNCEQVEKDKSVQVYYFDSYQKELASPKILGGYEIKR